MLHPYATTKMVIPIAAIGEAFLAMASSDDIPSYLVILERLGSFGLVAFLVWYFVKYALPLQRQDYITANQEQRRDHIAAQAKQEEREIIAKTEQRKQYIESMDRQRTDFLDALRTMHAQSDRLASSVENLAQATYSHVAQAKNVWKAQGFDMPESPKHSN